MNRSRLITISFIMLVLASVGRIGTAYAQAAEQDPEKDRMQEEIARLQKAFNYFQSERDQLKSEVEKERAENELLKQRLERFTDALQKNKQAIEIYKQKLKNVSDTPTQVQADLDRANLKNVQMESELNKLNSKLQEISKEWEKEQRLRKMQEQMTQDKELAAHDAEMKAEALTRQVKLMEAEQSKLAKQISALTKQAETDYAEYLSMEERVAENQAKMDANAQEVQNGLEEITRLQQALKKSDEEYLSLKNEMQQKESEFASRLRKADSDVKRVDELARLSQEAETQVDAFKKQLKQEQQVRRDLEQKAREMEQSLLSQATGLQEEQRKTERLTQERDQLTQDLRVFEKALEEERARRQVQEDLAKRVKMSSGSIQRETETLQLKLKMAEEEKAAAQKKESEMKNAMDALLRSQQISQNNLKTLQADHQAMLDDYQSIQQQLAEVEKLKNDAQQNVALLKKALTQERKVRTEKEQQAAQLQTESSSVDARVAEWTDQVNQLKAKLDAVQRENAMLKESLASTEVQDRKTKPIDTEELQKARESVASLTDQLQAVKKALDAERKKGYESAQLDLGDQMEDVQQARLAAEKRAADLEAELAKQRDALAAAVKSETQAADKTERNAVTQLETRLKEQQNALKNSEKKNEQLLAESEKSAARLKELEDRLTRQEIQIKQTQLALKQQSATVGAVRDMGAADRTVFGQTTSETQPVKKFVKAVDAQQDVTAESTGTKTQAQETVQSVVSSADAVGAGQKPADDYADLEAVLAEVEPSASQKTKEQDDDERQETAMMSKAFALYSGGEIAKAKELLDQILAANPNQVDALGMAGVIAWQEGNLDAAVAQLEKSLSLDDRNARAHNYMGIVQNSLQNTARAEKEFKRAMELDTGYDEPLFNLAVILATSDAPRIDEARRYYERALALGSERNNSLEEILYP